MDHDVQLKNRQLSVFLLEHKRKQRLITSSSSTGWLQRTIPYKATKINTLIPINPK